jgi:hypothetical protein
MIINNFECDFEPDVNGNLQIHFKIENESHVLLITTNDIKQMNHLISLWNRMSN